MALGVLVGSFVGELDGLLVGEALGDIDGEKDGAGLKVGGSDGDTVG